MLSSFVFSSPVASPSTLSIMASYSEAEHGPPEEDAPLLSTADSHIRPTTEASRERPSQFRILVTLLLHLLFLDFGYELIEPAQTRVFESIYCKEYYRNHEPGLIGSDGGDGVDEKWCKLGVIQGEVAMLKGWQVTFDSIGSTRRRNILSPEFLIFQLRLTSFIYTVLIFSIPWGNFADSYGRKPVILMLSIALLIRYAYIQLICWFEGALPLRLAWLSAIHTALGGSVSVGNALIYTMVSDVVPEGKRYIFITWYLTYPMLTGISRATLFFQVVAASFITQFLAPLVSAALMDRSPWIPILLGLCVELVAVGIIASIPETLNYSGSLSPKSIRSSVGTTTSVKPVQIWRSLLHLAHDSISFLILDVRVVLILSAFAVHMLLQNRDILLQYVSTRYQTSLALATVFISIRSGLVLLLCLIVLPASNIFFRRRFGPQWSDLLLSRASAALIALGFLMIGLAPNRSLLIFALVINSIGWGLFSFLRSLLTSLVEAHHVARLNTFIGVFDTIGYMIGSPLLAMLFKTGLELGGVRSGLPFLFHAAIFAMIGMILSGIKV